jgi:hypothetical protein
VTVARNPAEANAKSKFSQTLRMTPRQSLGSRMTREVVRDL